MNQIRAAGSRTLLLPTAPGAAKDRDGRLQPFSSGSSRHRNPAGSPPPTRPFAGPARSLAQVHRRGESSGPTRVHEMARRHSPVLFDGAEPSTALRWGPPPHGQDGDRPLHDRGPRGPQTAVFASAPGRRRPCIVTAHLFTCRDPPCQPPGAKKRGAPAQIAGGVNRWIECGS